MVNKYFLLSLILISVTVCSGDKYGNILDTSWELPEPQGVPKSACERDIQKMYINLRNMTLWAYEMWDASSKAPTGVFEGSQYHLGNWDECLGEVRPPDGSEGVPRQYCMVMTYFKPVPLTQYPTDVTPLDSAYNKLYRPHNSALVSRNIAFWGICTPASCQPPELTGMLQEHFHNESVRIADSRKRPLTAAGSTNGSTDVRHEVQALLPWGCHTPNEPVEVTYGAIGFFIVMGLNIAAVIMATWYHWYIRRVSNNKDCEVPRTVTTFSLITSVQKLGQTERTEELRILNGMRVISILIIIFGHRFGGTFAGPVINRNFLEVMHSKFPSVFVSFGDLAVDTFLEMSGLVLGYRLMQVNTKTPLNMPLLILHRYLRLMPAFAVMIAFFGHVLPLLGSGPLWPAVVGPEVVACRQNWWLNFLMLNNYFNMEQMCIVQSWYMSCDFHFFLVSLGVIWLVRSRSSPRLGLACLAFLLLASILIPFFVTYYLELPATLLFNEDFLRNPRASRMFQESYIKSHMRASSYLVGFITGYILAKYLRPGTKVLSLKTSMTGCAIALSILLGIMSTRLVFYHPHKSYDALEAAFYASLHRPVWATAISLLILCCALGEVPPVSTLLGWSAWTPLSRLVYGAYLAHMAVQYRDMGIVRTAKFLDVASIFGLMTGDLFYAFSASFIIYLIVEHPTRQLTNFLLSSTVRESKDTVYSTEPHKGTNKDQPDSPLPNNVVLFLNEKKNSEDVSESHAR